MPRKKDLKHIALRDRIGKLHEHNLSLGIDRIESFRRISEEVGIPTGWAYRFQVEKFTVRYYWSCYCSVKANNFKKSDYKISKESCRLGGKRTHELHPNHCNETLKKYRDEHPEFYVQCIQLLDAGRKKFHHMLKTDESFATAVKEKLSAHGKKNGRRILSKYWNSQPKFQKIRETYANNPNIARERTLKIIQKDPKLFYSRMRELSKKGAPLAFKSLITKSKICHDGEKFLSKSEVVCYQYLRGLGLTREQINHEYSVGNYHIDFFPLNKFFLEYHPILPLPSYNDGSKTVNQYYSKRRKILDDNGYSGYPLLVIGDLHQLNKISEAVQNVR